MEVEVKFSLALPFPNRCKNQATLFLPGQFSPGKLKVDGWVPQGLGCLAAKLLAKPVVAARKPRQTPSTEIPVLELLHPKRGTGRRFAKAWNNSPAVAAADTSRGPLFLVNRIR